MRIFKTSVFILAILLSFNPQAQEQELKSETKIDKKTYYEKRAEEDAKFEQQFTAKTEAEEEKFWKEQKTYEKNLKKKDRAAYTAYMQGKRDAYSAHYEHCSNHCHHSDHYYHHASFYYYRYDGYYYRHPQQRSGINTRVGISTPNVRLGLF
ncbi:hypothetical protein [Flavisericum labens]|uniref:hypothetical protein n=1 Tax=Flavisericum labens TaxID=3377112 RepID=UPI00387B2083